VLYIGNEPCRISAILEEEGLLLPIQSNRHQRKGISCDVLLESGRAEMPITVRLEKDLVENFPIVGDLVKQGKLV
jgi:hypothetical protein